MKKSTADDDDGDYDGNDDVDDDIDQQKYVQSHWCETQQGIDREIVLHGAIFIFHFKNSEKKTQFSKYIRLNITVDDSSQNLFW